MLQYIFNNFLLIYLMELGAAIAGTYYLIKVKDPRKEIRLFVYYSWLVVVVELVGLYPTIAYFSDYEIFSFIENKPYERNYWWYNCYNIIKFYIIYVFFIRQLNNDNTRKKLYVISGLLIGSFILEFFITDSFFKGYSAYTAIVGSVFLILLILMYHFSLLKSNRILVINKSIEFYISIGLMVWHISVTPLFIYTKYFSLANAEFVEFHGTFLQLINIFLYGITILGFLVCAKIYRGENLAQTGKEIKI